MKPKSKEFRDLEQEWATKLKDSGFEDAEIILKNGSRHLKQRSDYAYQHTMLPSHKDRQESSSALEEQSFREARLDFYMSVAQQVAEGKFDSDRDRRIMECFSEGMSNRVTEETLAQEGLGCHHETIRHVQRRYLHVWGLRSYTPRQRNLRLKQ